MMKEKLAKTAELKARLGTTNTAQHPDKPSVTLPHDSNAVQPQVVSHNKDTSNNGPFQSCNTCGGEYYNTQDYRAHFKSELHRVNLKRKMKNLAVFKTEDDLLAAGMKDLTLLA